MFFFVNYSRTYFFSLLQVVCDPKLKIVNIVVRWPGSTHDSRIFRNSTIRERLENDHLIGDSGYVCTRYLLTSVLHEQNEAETRYNVAHRRARNVVERTFGVWKKRFPCFTYTLRTKLETTQLIILATAILHNFALERREAPFEDVHVQEEDHNIVLEHDRPAGINWRNIIIRNHFM